MIKLNGDIIEVNTFPNGEIFIDINEDLILDKNILNLHFEKDQDLLSLLYITDYIHELGNSCSLQMFYIPYSRMDRKENNRLFTLKTVIKLINSMKFEKVYVLEPHSDVSLALLDRVDSNTTLILSLTQNLIEKLLDTTFTTLSQAFLAAEKANIYLVYPDTGALKRYNKLFKYSNIISCSKEREFDTGRITKLSISNDVDFSKVKSAIIVDDLCSRGGTFKLVGEMLHNKGVEDVYLAVSHCEDTIFKGDLLNTDTIKKIVTTDSLLNGTHEKIIVHHL